MTTLHTATDLSEVGEPEPSTKQFVPGEHPAITCRTCAAEVTLVDVDNVPRSNVCLGVSANPRACNTRVFRRLAGADTQMVVAGDDT